MRAGQLPSPAPTTPAPPTPTRFLPMEFGDRLVDETGEWEIAGRPYMTAGGKTAHVRIKRLEGDSTEIRVWGAHERIAVRRVSREKGAER